MAGEEILIVLMFFAVIFVLLLFYVAIIGRIGLQFFKYNVPFMKRRGTWYLIKQKDGRYKIIYDKFKTEWKWQDDTITTIRRNFERIAQTAEPLVFLKEGYAVNPILGEDLPKEEQSKHINNIIKLFQANERLKAQMQYQQQGGFMKILPIITFVMAAIAAVMGLAIFFTLNDINAFIATLKPLVPLATEYFKSNPPKVI